MTATVTERRPFGANEIRFRQQRFAEALATRGIAGAVASSYANSYYLSGAPIHPFGRPVAIVLNADGDTTLIASIIEQAHVEAQATVDHIRYYDDLGVGCGSDGPMPLAESFARLLAEECSVLGLSRGRIGFEEAAVAVQSKEQWQGLLPEVAFEPVGRLLASLRAVLTTAELDLVRAADSVADHGLAAVLEALRAGADAREVDTFARHRMLDVLGAEHAGSPFAVRIDTGLGDATRGAGHSEWVLWSGDERPHPGQVLVTGVDVLLWGYAGNVERTIAVEPVTNRVLQDFRTMIEACRAGTAAVRVGSTLGDVDRACKSVLAAAGYGTRSGSGLGRGIVSWEGNIREPLMDVRSCSDLPLEAGMALSVEPDLLTVDGTYRHCNTVIVTDRAPLVDSSLDWGVIVMDPPPSVG